MTTKAEAKPRSRRLFLLMKPTSQRQRLAGMFATFVSSPAAIRRSMEQATRESLWISSEPRLTEAFLKHVSWPTRSLGDAILVHSVSIHTLPILANCFKRLAYSDAGDFLPIEELAEALQASNRMDLFIGGAVDPASRAITLWRGNLESLTVPFSAFGKSGNGTAPDFSRFSVVDCGQTIRLGNYEAATDAILYEFDGDYRRRILKERRESERSFGASLRRLRKQRGMRREDFGSAVAAKTIARIEQGKVRRIRRKTLAALAGKLHVKPDEIATY